MFHKLGKSDTNLPITVYCLVVEHYRAHAALYPIRHGGFAPEVSDEEVSTLEICGEYLQHQTAQDLFDYCHAYYRHFFPKLTDRTLLVRQAANLWQVKAALQQRLTHLSGPAADPGQALDTLPVPVCPYTRGGRRDKCLPLAADYGHGAAQKLDSYGCKLGLRITRGGMITPCPLLAARPHDINHLDTLVEGFTGLVPADQGFRDALRQDLWQTLAMTSRSLRPSVPGGHHPRTLRRCLKLRRAGASALRRSARSCRHGSPSPACGSALCGTFTSA